MSEGLKRARAPFRMRNALTGLGIVGFVAAVYTYSISAVKQDDFSDIPIVTPGLNSSVKTIEDELAEKAKAGGRGVGAIMGLGSSPQGEGVRVVQDPQKQASGFASPQQSPLSSPPLAPTPGSIAAVTEATKAPASPQGRSESRLIYGAPDVDRLGRLRDSSIRLNSEKRLV